MKRGPGVRGEITCDSEHRGQSQRQRRRCCAPGAGDGGGATDQGVRVDWGGVKGKARGAPLEPPEEQPHGHLDLGLLIPEDKR